MIEEAHYTAIAKAFAVLQDLPITVINAREQDWAKDSFYIHVKSEIESKVARSSETLLLCNYTSKTRIKIMRSVLRHA